MTPISCEYAGGVSKEWGLFFVKPKAALCGSHPFSAVDLTFDTVSQRIFKSNVKSEAALESNFADVPLVLAFVNELAATRYECQNRDIGMKKNFGRV